MGGVNQDGTHVHRMAECKIGVVGYCIYRPGMNGVDSHFARDRIVGCIVSSVVLDGTEIEGLVDLHCPIEAYRFMWCWVNCCYGYTVLCIIY